MKKCFELFLTFFKVGGLTFGGGMAMLPMLKREVVENKKWSTEEELLDVYAIGQCTPGIIAVNTATYIGYQQKGIPGAIWGTFGMIAPSLIIISLIASILNQFVSNPIIMHALSGIRIAVCAMMFNTIVSLIKTGVKDVFGVILFLAGFLLATFSPIPTLVLVVVAALSGILITMRKEKKS